MKVMYRKIDRMIERKRNKDNQGKERGRQRKNKGDRNRVLEEMRRER